MLKQNLKKPLKHHDVYFSFDPLGPPEVGYGEEFEVHITNFSNKAALVQHSTFALKGHVTGFNYAMKVKIIDSGCYAVPPGGGCMFRFKNFNSFNPGHIATVLASIKFKFYGETILRTINRGKWEGKMYYPYIGLVN